MINSNDIPYWGDEDPEFGTCEECGEERDVILIEHPITKEDVWLCEDCYTDLLDEVEF